MNKRIQFSLFGQNKYQKEGMHVGVRIDRLVLLSLLAGTLYLFFVGAFHSVPLAAASAFLALALLRKIAGRFPTLRRGTPASRRLEALSLMPRQEAEKAVERALDRAYPGQRGDACLALILRHPAAGKLTPEDVAEAWRSRSAPRVLLVFPGQAGPGALKLAEKLPGMQLIDGEQLSQLLSAEDVAALPERRRRPFPGKALEAACRMQAKKTALTGGLMCLIYLVTGVFFNLAAGLLLLLLAGIAARQKRRPRLLFQ